MINKNDLQLGMDSEKIAQQETVKNIVQEIAAFLEMHGLSTRHDFEVIVVQREGLSLRLKYSRQRTKKMVTGIDVEYRRITDHEVQHITKQQKKCIINPMEKVLDLVIETSINQEKNKNKPVQIISCIRRAIFSVNTGEKIFSPVDKVDAEQTDQVEYNPDILSLFDSKGEILLEDLNNVHKLLKRYLKKALKDTKEALSF